jgi:hypothetical protein
MVLAAHSECLHRSRKCEGGLCPPQQHRDEAANCDGEFPLIGGPHRRSGALRVERGEHVAHPAGADERADGMAAEAVARANLRPSACGDPAPSPERRERPPTALIVSVLSESLFPNFWIVSQIPSRVGPGAHGPRIGSPRSIGMGMSANACS